MKKKRERKNSIPVNLWKMLHFGGVAKARPTFPVLRVSDAWSCGCRQATHGRPIAGREAAAGLYRSLSHRWPPLQIDPLVFIVRRLQAPSLLTCSTQQRWRVRVFRDKQPRGLHRGLYPHSQAHVPHAFWGLAPAGIRRPLYTHIKC